MPEPTNEPTHEALKPTIARLIGGERLSEADTAAAFRIIMSGDASAAQIAAVLAVLQHRGVTEDELVGAATVMREVVEPVPIADQLRDRIIDTCGTGGAAKSFNISTAAAIVAAGIGRIAARNGDPALLVAKHGNRSRSGRGSAEVIAELGVNLDADAATQARCLEAAGVCFCFAMKHHPAMRHAGPARQALGVPTVFNLLGPLTNPAGATRQLLGVYDPRFVELLARALARLGARRAMIVHGDDGLDELTTTTTSQLCRVENNATALDRIDPAELGIDPATIDQLQATSAADGASIIRSIIDGEPGPKRDIVRLNAAAAAVVGDAASDIREGLELASEAIDSGAARHALNALIRTSNADTD